MASNAWKHDVFLFVTDGVSGSQRNGDIEPILTRVKAHTAANHGLKACEACRLCGQPMLVC